MTNLLRVHFSAGRDHSNISAAFLHINHKPGQQVLRFAPAFLVDAVADLWTVDFALDETDALEFGEMLRDRCLRKRELLNNVATYACILSGQELKYRNARWVPECFGEISDSVLEWIERIFF
jgi:hypothetical protein